METLKFVMTSTFYPPYHLGGDAVHVKYLAEELAKRGHEVHVMFSMDAYRMKRKELLEPIDPGKVQTHPLNSPYGKLTTMKVYAFGNSRFIMENYRKLISDVKPDIVHHHNISLLGHGILEKAGNYRQLYTAHDYWLVCQRNDLMRKGQLCNEKRCKSCAMSSGRPPQLWRKWLDVSSIDCLICPSQYIADNMAALGRPIAVIPNFVPNPPTNIAGVKNPGYFLYLGVLEPHKGIGYLINSFPGNRERLIIAGRGSQSFLVERDIEMNKLGPGVRYIGWVEDKWSLMKGACAMVLPSLWPENCPLSVLEAMSVGTPTFCTDMGGTKEIVSKLSDSLIIPVTDLKSGLARLTAPNIPRETVICAFRERYSADIYMKKYMKVVKGGCPST